MNISGLKSVVDRFGTRRFGQQVGKTSISGVQTFVKKGEKGKQIYTTIDAATKGVVRTKEIITSPKGSNLQNQTIKTFDKNGDLVSSSRVLEHGTLTIPNKFAKKIQRFHNEYNKFGQVVKSDYTLISPSVQKPRVSITKNINGNISKTYVDSTMPQTSIIRKIDCVG